MTILTIITLATAFLGATGTALNGAANLVKAIRQPTAPAQLK